MIRLEPKVKSKGIKRTPLKRKPPKVRNPKTDKMVTIKIEVSNIPHKVAFLTKTPPKLRIPLKPMSTKMQKRMRDW